jgi:nucleotide-binding universal stress UspA family protein
LIAINRILVATDFSEAASAALLYGMNLARTLGAQLDVLHVVNDLGGPPADLEAVARHALDALLAGTGRLRARGVLLTSDDAAERIVSYAREAKADLILIGTHGRTGIAQFFMGSVAQHVVRSAHCPVLTVRHPQCEILHTGERRHVAAG